MAKKHKNTLVDEAKKAKDFDSFCEFFPGCNGCPLANASEGCSAEMWQRWRTKRHG